MIVIFMAIYPLLQATTKNSVVINDIEYSLLFLRQLKILIMKLLVDHVKGEGITF